MSSECGKNVVLSSPELLTTIASFDEGPLSFRRYRQVSKVWLELSRSDDLLKCLTSSEACLAYRVGGSYRMYSGAWDDRCLTSRRVVGCLQREVGRAVSVGRYRFFFEWLERDSESIAIWDMVDWWRLTVSRTEPCDNHVCRGGATCGAGDRIFLFGGSASDGSTLDSIYVLQTRQLNKGWERSEKRLTHATSDACCELVGSELVVVGGCARNSAAGGGWRAVSYAQFFDPQTLEQTRLVSIPEEFHRCCATSCVSAKTGMLVVVGGGPSSRWEELQLQPVTPRSPLYSDRPHQEAAAYRQRLLHTVLSFDANSLEWNSLGFPLVLRDLPSVLSLPDGSIVVAGAIAKPVDATSAAAVNNGANGSTDVDDYPPQPPVRFDPVDKTWRVLGSPRSPVVEQRPVFLTNRRTGRTFPRFYMQAPVKPHEIAPELVVTDLALLDLDQVYQHLFQPNPKSNNLLPRDQLPPALLDEFANATPQSGKLWWYAERHPSLNRPKHALHHAENNNNNNNTRM